MKILILSTKMPWPPKDGGAIATMNMAAGIAKCGSDVTLLTMNTGKHYFPPENIPDQITDLIHIRSVYIDTRIRPFKLLLNLLFSSSPYIAERYLSDTFQVELNKCLAERDFDIVQIEGPYLYYYIQFIGKGPVLSLRAHNLEHRIWDLRSREEKNPLKRMYFKSLSRRIYNLEKKLLSEIDVLVPISTSDAEGFRQMDHNLPVQVCPAGMELDNYTPGNTEGNIRLFYIGALDWAPNQEGLDWFFEKIWPAIRKRWPELVLNIAGRNSTRYFSGKLPPNVYPEGEIDDAVTFFRNHNVMIVPLLSGSGIRIKILEAMAMGKVVICSSIAAAGLGTKDGEHLYIADTADDYLKVLELFGKQPRLMYETGHQARQFVIENFDNFVISKKLISFYKAQLT